MLLLSYVTRLPLGALNCSSKNYTVFSSIPFSVPFSQASAFSPARIAGKACPSRGVTARACASASGAISVPDMDEGLVDLVRQIHATPTKAVFYVAGGGAQVPSSCPSSQQL
jgi:hypothetical protein